MINPDESIDPAHAMYGIRLMALKGRAPGYLVKIERRHVGYTQWFGFALCGGQAAALIAAQAWRDEQTRRLEPLTKQEFVSQIRPNNTSGAAGVVRTTQRTKKRSGQIWSADYWVARPPRGIKVGARYFPISKHGEEGAKMLAQAQRSLLLDVFREAIAAGWCEKNPVEDTRSKRIETKRQRLSLE